MIEYHVCIRDVLFDRKGAQSRSDYVYFYTFINRW